MIASKVDVFIAASLAAEATRPGGRGYAAQAALFVIIIAMGVAEWKQFKRQRAMMMAAAASIKERDNERSNR